MTETADLVAPIRALARRVYRTRAVPAVLSAEDLEQEGWLGALRAEQRYQPAQGLSRRVYALVGARWAMLEAIRQARLAGRGDDEPVCHSFDASLVDGGRLALHEVLPDRRLGNPEARVEFETRARAHLTPTQHAVFRAILDHRTVEDTAASLGLPTRVVHAMVSRRVAPAKTKATPTPRRRQGLTLEEFKAGMAARHAEANRRWAAQHPAA